jgi:hypothetical protein
MHLDKPETTLAMCDSHVSILDAVPSPKRSRRSHRRRWAFAFGRAVRHAVRELRNIAVFATGGFLAKRHPRPPDPLLPSKLPSVRRAHTPAELLTSVASAALSTFPSPQKASLTRHVNVIGDPARGGGGGQGAQARGAPQAASAAFASGDAAAHRRQRASLVSGRTLVRLRQCAPPSP